MFDLVDGKILPFYNIVDKGFTINLPAGRAGQQTVLQPMFARSGSTFKGMETVVSSSVASDCSGNKRAMNRSKMSNILQRGLDRI